jgi:hypothetical protein
MKFHIIIHLLSLFFILLIIFSVFNKSIEAFSFGSLTSGSSESATPSPSTEDSQYKYLAPLPPDNTWSQDIQNAFVTKFNSMLLAQDPSATLITSPTTKQFNYMLIASEEEAKYFIDNGVWPWDNYVNNIINKIKESVDENTKKLLEFVINIWSKTVPNREVFKMLISSQLPQNTILSSLNPSTGTGININGTQYLTCKSGEGTIKQPDGTNIVFPSNGLYPYILPYKTATNGSYTLDYSTFEKIPGFTFDSSACNICQTPNFNYLDPSNNCFFSINTPEAYNIYSGSNLKSSPSSTSTTSPSTSTTSTTTPSTSSTSTTTPSTSTSSSSWF